MRELLERITNFRRPGRRATLGRCAPTSTLARVAPPATVLFSIVTPSFRQLDWLRLCVASVADQVHRSRVGLRVEHLIQDAGTPGILELARELEQRSAGPASWAGPGGSGYRLEVLVEPDRGMYDAINRGPRRANGELCAYVSCRRSSATNVDSPELDAGAPGSGGHGNDEFENEQRA